MTIGTNKAMCQDFHLMGSMPCPARADATNCQRWDSVWMYCLKRAFTILVKEDEDLHKLSTHLLLFEGGNVDSEMGPHHEIYQILAGDFQGTSFCLVEAPMDSMISTNCKNKRVYSVTRNQFSSEDSGWSLYIKDSVASSNMKDASVSSGSEFSSMFSDAGSLPKKIYAGDGYATSTRSISKRRKTEVTFVDDDLEDTASSPICNSEAYDLQKLCGKVQGTGSDLNMLKDVDQLREYDNSASSQEIGNSSNQTDQVMHSGFIGNNICYKGLRERGLCLVPVSMLFNF